MTNPRCPKRFVPSFHVLLLGTSSPHEFRKLHQHSVVGSGQCSAQCCKSRDCLLSFFEDEECYGVTGAKAKSNSTKYIQEPSIELQVAIIDRNKGWLDKSCKGTINTHLSLFIHVSLNLIVCWSIWPYRKAYKEIPWLPSNIRIVLCFNIRSSYLYLILYIRTTIDLASAVPNQKKLPQTTKSKYNNMIINILLIRK